MKKILMIFSVVAIMLLAGCDNEPVACTADAKLCPDGSAVGRLGPDCEFAECPTAQGECNYDDSSRNYVSQDQDECKTLLFQCVEPGKPFFDVCGCGCGAREDTTARQYCTDNQREADACIQLYKPVCGWFNPEKIQCIKYPCAQTFSNSCFACMDDKILFWTEGECPK